MVEITLLSGLGVKGPACLRLCVNGERLLLDCGHGPDANAPFDPAWLEGIDRVIISHDHGDHIGGAGEVVRRGLPIHATAQTARSLPSGADVTLLPETGEAEIAGMCVTTGRNGHALGGVWLHFGIKDGLFYSGDWSEESDWFAFDPPPAAATALIDCSYHLDDIPQRQRIAALDQTIDQLDGLVLLPVPPSGRAGELALHLVNRFGDAMVALDGPCHSAALEAFASGGLSSKAAKIEPLLRRDAVEQADALGSVSARFVLMDTPNADGGLSQALVQLWRKQGRLGRDAHVIFTGYLNETARPMLEKGEAHFCRWNVHPPLRDQKAMVQRLGARRFVPLFCEAPKAYATEMGFGADVILNRILTL